MIEDFAQLMTDAARELQERPDTAATMDSAVELARREIEGCDAAAISIVRRRGRIDTAASTHESALQADIIQYETGQGPCLETIWEAERVEVPDIDREQRWPAWRDRMVRESGFRGMLVQRLHTTSDVLGALNLYATRPRTFGPLDQHLAAGLATQVAIAIAGSREVEKLHTALSGRTVIGQAQGIVMERYGLDAARAFALLTRLSSHTNRKLIQVATDIVETRVVPATEPRADPQH